MPTFYIRGQSHTVACALREVLEETHAEDFVSCTVMHPLDNHIVIEAPCEASIRNALLTIKEKISRFRSSIVS